MLDGAFANSSAEAHAINGRYAALRSHANISHLNVKGPADYNDGPAHIDQRHRHAGYSAKQSAVWNNLQLIVYWGSPLGDLNQVLDSISDWGPFELVDAIALGEGAEGKVKVFCCFAYHGPKAQRSHYEDNLKSLLKDYADWEEIKPPDYGR